MKDVSEGEGHKTRFHGTGVAKRKRSSSISSMGSSGDRGPDIQLHGPDTLHPQRLARSARHRHIDPGVLGVVEPALVPGKVDALGQDEPVVASGPEVNRAHKVQAAAGVDAEGAVVEAGLADVLALQGGVGCWRRVGEAVRGAFALLDCVTYGVRMGMEV